MSPHLNRRARHRLIIALLVIVCTLAGARLNAQQTTPIDLSAIGKGEPPFPLVWRPYRERPLPAVDLRNGQQLTRDLLERTLRLSLEDFLNLVVENDLDLLAARYKAAIAEV